MLADKIEIPDQSVEALKALPAQVTWSDVGYSGGLLSGRLKKVNGEFFSIDLQGNTYEDLERKADPDELVDVPAHFSGSIKSADNGDKYVDAGTLTVKEKFRRNGLGERLATAMACVAAENNCKRIEISFSHPSALKFFRSIYGDSRLYFTQVNDEGKVAPLDITPEEATDTIQEERDRAVQYGVRDGQFTHHPKTDEEILAGAINGVDAWIDVKGFDTSGLEQPLNPTYSKQVANTFLKSGDRFGKAQPTRAELAALRALYREHGRSIFATLESIYDNGYPVPDEITPEMVALTGVAHACGVTIHLAEIRGLEGKDSTYESYTVKNRFDRFTALHLPKSLKSDWEAPVKRDSTANLEVVYPEGVDNELIHGINAPHRFFPAQTMRHLEFARLGKLDSDTEKAIGIHMVRDEQQFAVDWEDLVPVIESATDVNQLAGDLGAEIAAQLLKNGLSQEQVTGILKKGYGIEGMKKEHGNVPEVHQVFARLILALKAHPETAYIGLALSK